MSEGKGQRKWPIPVGFVWNHKDDCYKHPDGRVWNPDTNEVLHPNGRIVNAAPQFVDSTSDARTVNNDGNIMRHNYRVLSDAEKASMTQLKDLGAQFVSLCDSIGASRELSLAKTKMEEAVMWAVKHVTK